MPKSIKKLSFGLFAGAATIALAVPAASAATGTNPRTGCIGANNMMPAPGMSTQGWAALPDNNPGIGPSLSGMVTAMIVSDPSWPTMCTG